MSIVWSMGCRSEKAEDTSLTEDTAVEVQPEGTTDGECSDGIDNDNDAMTDCDDSDCVADVFCEVSPASGTVDNPGLSCKDILDHEGSIGDGLYWINPDANESFQVYCDMTTAGGGWTLLLNSDDVDTAGPDTDWNGWGIGICTEGVITLSDLNVPNWQHTIGLSRSYTQEWNNWGGWSENIFADYDNPQYPRYFRIWIR